MKDRVKGWAFEEIVGVAVVAYPKGRDMSKFFDQFERTEMYPKCLAERGVPSGMLFEYVSHTYLNGFINYVRPIFAIMIERYRPLTMASTQKVLELLNSQSHTDYRPKEFDDVLILAESESSDDELQHNECSPHYWFFWSDRDCSDCSIGRFPKDDRPKEQIIAMLRKHFDDIAVTNPAPPQVDERGNGSESITGRFLELPLPRGWKNF